MRRRTFVKRDYNEPEYCVSCRLPLSGQRNTLPGLCEHCSGMARRAEKAEREGQVTWTPEGVPIRNPAKRQAASLTLF
jgi:hypothetical protein